MINTKQELLTIINKHMESAPASVRERLKTELDYVTKNEGCAEFYMAARGMVNLSREMGYYSNSRGSLGASLIAFLLGVTEINPLKYNLPFEVFAGIDYDRDPYIDLNFDEEFIPHAQRFMQVNFPSVPVSLADSCQLPDEASICIGAFTACARLKKLADITGVDVYNIPLDDEKTLDMLIAADTSGIPTFESDFAHDLIKSTAPKVFDDFVRIYGVSNASYVWTKWDDATKESIVISEMPPYSEVIPFRDDVLMYLLDKGINRATAYKIMTDVRKGKGLTAEYEAIITKANVPAWYVTSCKNVEYLFPKAHSVSYTMLAFRIAWFKAHYPEAYTQAL